MMGCVFMCVHTVMSVPEMGWGEGRNGGAIFVPEMSEGNGHLSSSWCPAPLLKDRKDRLPTISLIASRQNLQSCNASNLVVSVVTCNLDYQPALPSFFPPPVGEVGAWGYVTLCASFDSSPSFLPGGWGEGLASSFPFLPPPQAREHCFLPRVGLRLTNLLQHRWLYMHWWESLDWFGCSLPALGSHYYMVAVWKI